MNSFTSTLSQRERVSPEATGEGLLSFEARERRSRRPRPRDVNPASDFFHHPVESFGYLFIGESKLYEAVRFDHLSSRSVTLHLAGMVFSINLDRQPKIITTEVCNEAGYRNLPAKLQSIKATVSKLLPQNVFRGRALRAQAPGSFDEASTHIGILERQGRKPQPLTRPLRGHPLPSGEGFCAGVKR